jgi:hypothetical protein
LRLAEKRKAAQKNSIPAHACERVVVEFVVSADLGLAEQTKLRFQVIAPDQVVETQDCRR